jgi:hypothetical protein
MDNEFVTENMVTKIFDIQPTIIFDYPRYQTYELYKKMVSTNGNLILKLDSKKLTEELWCLAIEQNLAIFKNVKFLTKKIIETYEKKLKLKKQENKEKLTTDDSLLRNITSSIK